MLSVRIKQLMLTHGILSENELSQKAGIPQTTLHYILTGKSKPSSSSLKPIADYFGVSINELLGKPSLEELFQHKQKSLTNIADMLRFLMEEVGYISEGELARQTGVSQQVINNVINGKTKNPRSSSVKPIADFFGINIPQLMGKESLPKEAMTGELGYLMTSAIPLISWEQVFLLPELLADQKNIFKKNISIKGKLNQFTYALVVNNDSMAPEFKSGNILIIDYQKSPKPGNFIIAQVLSYSRPLFGELTCDNSNQLWIQPTNKKYHPVQLLNNYRVLGVIIKSQKK